MPSTALAKVLESRISPSTISTRASNIDWALDLVRVKARTERSLASNLATTSCPTPPVAPATKILSVFDIISFIFGSTALF